MHLKGANSIAMSGLTCRKSWLALYRRTISVASFPGLHAQLLSLAVRKAGEGLDGLIT